MRNLWIFASLFLVACSSKEEVNSHRLKSEHLQATPLISSTETPFAIEDTLQRSPPPKYPWDFGTQKGIPPITKEFFRCQGSPLNAPKTIINEYGQTEEIIDCGGFEEHGLPLQEGKEFVQPVLIEILNGLQEKFGERVVITSGHRCPKHNTYVDSSHFNKTTRHLLGAEVSFYVESVEMRPLEIVEAIKAQFSSPFARWDKETDVSTKPWYNDEIFIKLYKKEEGRNFDNRHPYPYISIQVRFDKNKNEKITYTWEKANRQYLRK